MDYKNAGRPVTVEEMMAFRDRRAEIQREILAEQHLPVISFSMNIPGEIKTDERIRMAFAGLDYGQLTLVVKAGEVVQIERTLKERFTGLDGEGI